VSESIKESKINQQAEKIALEKINEKLNVHKCTKINFWLIEMCKKLFINPIFY